MTLDLDQVQDQIRVHLQPGQAGDCTAVWELCRELVEEIERLPAMDAQGRVISAPMSEYQERAERAEQAIRGALASVEKYGQAVNPIWLERVLRSGLPEENP